MGIRKAVPSKGMQDLRDEAKSVIVKIAELARKKSTLLQQLRNACPHESILQAEWPLVCDDQPGNRKLYRDYVRMCVCCGLTEERGNGHFFLTLTAVPVRTIAYATYQHLKAQIIPPIDL